MRTSLPGALTRARSLAQAKTEKLIAAVEAIMAALAVGQAQRTIDAAAGGARPAAAVTSEPSRLSLSEVTAQLAAQAGQISDIFDALSRAGAAGSGAAFTADADALKRALEAIAREVAALLKRQAESEEALRSDIATKTDSAHFQAAVTSLARKAEDATVAMRLDKKVDKDSLERVRAWLVAAMGRRGGSQRPSPRTRGCADYRRVCGRP